MKSNLSTLFISLIFLSFVAIGCSAVSDGKPAAEQATVEFHSKLDEGKFSDIYETTDQKFKDASDEEEMVKLFTAVHSKLGNVKNSATQNWRVSNYNLTTYLEMVQETEFEKGKATETFTFIIADKKATIGGYYITSMDMLTN